MDLKRLTRLISKDGSQNFIIPFRGANLETRYVRRSPNYISTYVSSHNGCTMGCKFCWLTQQGQTKFNHSSIDDYNTQLDVVLKHVPEKDNTVDKNKIRVNVNFMARGEALANKNVILNYPKLYSSLLSTTRKHGYGNVKMNISTIMPHTVKNKRLGDIFRDDPANIYYSFYSVDDKFRNYWMPNALPYNVALDKLAEYQHSASTSQVITFHMSFINGHNDDLEMVHKMAEAIKYRQFSNTKFNLVRFNPHPKMAKDYQEPSIEKLNEIFKIMSSAVTDNTIYNKSRIISRVGTDTYNSCGMFIEDHNL